MPDRGLSPADAPAEAREPAAVASLTRTKSRQPTYHRAVSVTDEIFPAKAHGRFVQTEWATGWFGVVSGFGDAAEFLTEHRAEFHATIDQVGLAIFFLQRHRVELTLKQLVHDCGQTVNTREHRLSLLWADCKAAVQQRSPAQWHEFADHHGELITALEQHDPSSYTFRYPVDTTGVTNRRPRYIDLAALQRHVDDLVSNVHGYLDMMSELEREAEWYNEP